MVYEEGPFVQAACFCDMTITGDDNTLSIIRIVDTITHTTRGPSPPEEMPAFEYKLVLVLILKPGKARGRSTIMLIPELPNGSTKRPNETTIHFDGEEKGSNIIMNVIFTFELEGLYWFNVLLDEVKITAIPLRVMYNPVKVGQPTPKA